MAEPLEGSADIDLSPPALDHPGLETDDSSTLTFQHAGKSHSYQYQPQASLNDLSQHVSNNLDIPPDYQKWLISPKPGLQRPPFDSQDKPPVLLHDIAKRKITLLGSTPAQVTSLNNSIHTADAQSRRRNGPIKPATPARSRDWKKLQDDIQYTFQQIRPLPYLPNPERSTRFLERLRDDPGIRASMVKHKWSVPLLTEMNPAEHTTHESKTLGLNRNAGEVIELRLRTDAYDGYRDYKTIRRTLCHELAHNVWGEHDRNFWDLCHAIEKEVETADWTRGGRAVSDQIYYDPSPEDAAPDHGGWQGGEYVLGGGGGKAASSNSSNAQTSTAGLSRREILARAAEERMKKANESSSNPKG